jgi:hypothetical protein
LDFLVGVAVKSARISAKGESMRLVSFAFVAVLFTAGCAQTQTAKAPKAAPPTPATVAAPGDTPSRPAVVGAGTEMSSRMTADDLDARMKVIGPTSGTLRTKLMSNQLADAAKDAQTLAAAFADVERFFQQNNKSDALMLAQQARTAASQAAGAATAGDQMKAQAAATSMQSVCGQCHRVYREGDAQTGYRIKAGAL